MKLGFFFLVLTGLNASPAFADHVSELYDIVTGGGSQTFNCDGWRLNFPLNSKGIQLIQKSQPEKKPVCWQTQETPSGYYYERDGTLHTDLCLKQATRTLSKYFNFDTLSVETRMDAAVMSRDYLGTTWTLSHGSVGKVSAWRAETPIRGQLLRQDGCIREAATSLETAMAVPYILKDEIYRLLNIKYDDQTVTLQNIFNGKQTVIPAHSLKSVLHDLPAITPAMVATYPAASKQIFQTRKKLACGTFSNFANSGYFLPLFHQGIFTAELSPLSKVEINGKSANIKVTFPDKRTSMMGVYRDENFDFNIITVSDAQRTKHAVKSYTTSETNQLLGLPIQMMTIDSLFWCFSK